MEKEIQFSKYQGAGNDFVMLDNFSGQYDGLTVKEVKLLCDRRFGIGADGLILINACDKADFEVDYYNADGTKSFCGNGSRCSIAFVNALKRFRKQTFQFTAIDGLHTGEMVGKEVKIDMQYVSGIEQLGDLSFQLNTGSPHFVQFDRLIAGKNIVELGRAIRFNDRYSREGINVNWVERTGDNEITVRTYERGVEDETLACGTGVTAAAIAYHHKYIKQNGYYVIYIKARGGDLQVSFRFDEKQNYHSIFLTGPADFVFKGTFNVG